MISDESLRKYEHIIKAKDFRRAYKKGTYFKRENFVLYVMPNEHGTSRIGFSISSKYIKLASARNRLRRRLKEIYRKKKRFLKKGFDIIFIVRKGATSIRRYEDLNRIINELFEKAGISI